jgi:hypothetical protein
MLSFQLKQAAIIALILSTTSPAAAQIRGHREIKTSEKTKHTKYIMQQQTMMTPAEPTSSSSLVSSSSFQLTSSTRIVGGTQAQRGVYPYYTQWVNGCGASLIHEDIVLSAAHCNEIPENQVIVGGYQDEVVGSGSVARTIVKRVVHPNYNSVTTVNDFVILKLNTPVLTNKPVTLNRVDANPTTGENLVVIGLGTLVENGNTPTYLQEVTVQAVAHATCNSQYGGDIDQVSMLCAGVPSGGKDSCQGDSGGPIVKIVNGIHTQVGVISWGNGCAQPGYSGVYARVSSAATWIDQQICILSANPPASCGGVATPVPAILKPTTKAPTSMPVTKAPTIKVTPKPTSSSTSSRPTTKVPTTQPTTARPNTKVTSHPTAPPTIQVTPKPTASPTTRKPTPATANTSRPTTKRPTPMPTLVPTEGSPFSPSAWAPIFL